MEKQKEGIARKTKLIILWILWAIMPLALLLSIPYDISNTQTGTLPLIASMYVTLLVPALIVTILLFTEVFKKEEDSKQRQKAISIILAVVILTPIAWPVPMFGYTIIADSIKIPIAIKQTDERAKQLREEILNYKTYADLSQFDLGMYKISSDGAMIYDITKPLTPQYNATPFGVFQDAEKVDLLNNPKDWLETYDVYTYNNISFIEGVTPSTSLYRKERYICKNFGSGTTLYEGNQIYLEKIKEMQEFSHEKMDTETFIQKLK